MNVLENILEEIENRKSFHEELLSQRDGYEIQKMYCEEELDWVREIIRSHMVEKENVTSAEIIRRFIDEKPYYEIKYKVVGEDEYTIGYGSYNLGYVIDWLNECFMFCGKSKVVSDNDDWISVLERMPEEKEVIVQDKDGEMLIGYVHYSEEMEWYECESESMYLTNVIAWQPLPEPYKEE